jgi:FkbM family methyltransferase
MYLEHLVPNAFAIFSSPRCFIKRLLNPQLVSFGLMANLDFLKKRRVFDEVDAIVDIGANIGQFAYMIHSVLPDKPVFSFEPDSDCFSNLQDTFATHKISGRCFQFALSNKEERAELNIYESPANNSMLARNGEIPKVVKTIECRTLDGLKVEFESYQSFFLKIDVQGAELLVLEGAKEFLSNCKFVQLEVSLTTSYAGNAKIEDVLQAMRLAGFTCWEIVDVLRNKKPNELGIVEMDLLFRKA